MRIEDRLENAGRALRSSVDGDGVTDPLSAVVDGSRSTDGRSRWVLLVAAAVVAVLAGVVGVLALGDDDERLVADEGETTDTSMPETTTSLPDGPDVVGEALGAFLVDPEEVGSMSVIGIPDALADLWMSSGDPAMSNPVPEVDFDERVVFAFTISEMGAGRCLGPPDGLALSGVSTVAPHFPESEGCDLSRSGVRYFLAVDRADLSETFDLVLASRLLDGAGPYALFVDISEGFASFTPPQEPSGGNLVPGAPDLEQPEPGREITFEGIGDVALGQTLPVSEVQVYEGNADCGYWGPGEPSHDGDEPLDGVVTIDGDVADIRSINVRRNPRYRTASGVGVGTTLETLERIYGNDLVVDRADASGTPTDGLVGRYSDVAAVRSGDRALTFQLNGDVVFGVKLSNADFWGDDEGCA